MATAIRETCIKITNPISRFWRRQQLKLENSFKVYKDPQVNEFFWFSCLLGGILKTDKVPQAFKKIWLVCNVSSVFTMLALNIACLVWYEEKNRTTFRKLSKPILSMAIVSTSNAIFYLYMGLIEKYTDSMDKRIKNMSFDDPTSEFNGKMSKLEIFLSSGPNLFFIVASLISYFLPDYELLRGMFSSHYPFNKDLQGYPTIILAIILCIQFLTIMQMSIELVCMFKLMKLFVAIMNRTFDFYLKQIANVGLSTLHQMENNHNEELLCEQNEELRRGRSSEEFIIQRNAIEENFEKEMAYFSKQIWSLIKINFYLQAMFENACATFLLVIYAILIPQAGQLLWVLHNPTRITAQLVNAIIFLPLNTYLFYKLCCIGTQLSETLDQFPIEVYSTPWHMMSKKTRRTIHIFLAQTQYEHRLRIFKTVPIDVILFYRFLDSLYSNGSFFHSILERSI